MEGKSGVEEVEVRVKENGGGGGKVEGRKPGCRERGGGEALRNWIPLLIAATSTAFSLLIVEQCVMKGRWYPFSDCECKRIGKNWPLNLGEEISAGHAIILNAKETVEDKDK